jgi:hypothetical protein
VNVEGIDGHIMERRRLVMAGAVTQSNCGPVILIMHQYAHSGKGHSIHSSTQLEWNGVDIDDKSARVGGKQRLVTFDGFSIPINIRRGLPYIDMHPNTDQEWEELPHILLTEDTNWDPTHMDHEHGDDPAWYEQQDDPPLLNSDFDLCGDYRPNKNIIKALHYIVWQEYKLGCLHQQRKSKQITNQSERLGEIFQPSPRCGFHRFNRLV